MSFIDKSAEFQTNQLMAIKPAQLLVRLVPGGRIVGSVKNWDKITVHDPFFVINTFFCPPRMYLALMHYQTLRYFHCKGQYDKNKYIYHGRF